MAIINFPNEPDPSQTYQHVYNGITQNWVWGWDGATGVSGWLATGFTITSGIPLDSIFDLSDVTGQNYSFAANNPSYLKWDLSTSSWTPDKVELSHIENVTLTRRYTQTNSMLTKDENIVDVTVSAQYRIANLKDFVLNVKDPETSLRQGIESALRHVVGDNTLEQTLTVGRENIAQEVQVRLQQILDAYATGLIVQQVNIEKTDPPAAVKDAFDDVVAAREDKERLQNEAERYALSIVPEARGQAQARIREAEGYKLEVVANAEGEVGRFVQLLEEYQKAPKVTRDRMYIDAIQNVLSSTTKIIIDIDSGNNIMLLPLDKMMDQGNKIDLSQFRLNQGDSDE